MKIYTIREISKKINIDKRTILQWEKELTGLIEFPRTKQGARIFTEVELDLLLEIKQLYTQKLSHEEIRECLQERLIIQNSDVLIEPEPETSLEVVSEAINPVAIEESSINNTELFFEAMDTYKQTFLLDVKEEIRNVVRKEVLEEVKKEISKGTFLTVKSLSDSIYKASEHTKAEIHELAETMEKTVEATENTKVQITELAEAIEKTAEATENTKAGIHELADTLEKTAENTSVSLRYLSNSIANSSIETSEEFFSLSKQLSETTEELFHYVDATNSEIDALAQVISKDREFYVEEREQYRQEIKQREAAFQDFLTSFRDAASAKEKKWWKFWA